ncbi:hypothetical protein N0M98_33055 [Paenibacillus doosanensis]|uniref:hypothetical protein n=1 Tax=Paenibacillus doosanensis TaxID=1229154 RepID=UPI002180284D|nr:hypothetical protein [Paenibacillus doosanensis]MCS7464913.1 hypothetical protein [Paenibacillus doosanensis]
MNVGSAKKAAADWVTNHASRTEGYRGAYFSGSTAVLPDEAELPASSDVDVMIVTAEAAPPLKPGKFIHRDALLEASYISWHQLASAEEVLTNYHLANGFRTNTIIADPTGHLHSLQAEVSRLFARRPWVRRRCLNVREKIENGLRAIDTAAPLHDLLTSWLFPTGVTTHLILVAALRNPTVRLRYLAAREVLESCGQESLYLELLELLGCAHLTAERTERHLDELARTFDAAAAASRTPFFFSSNISPASRPIAIDGSRELIRRGFHREAIFWIAATFARCHKILAADAPREQQQLLPAFEAVIADLGIRSREDFLSRAAEGIGFLPRLWEAAESIMANNAEIQPGD